MSAIYKTTWYAGSGAKGKALYEAAETEARRRGLFNHQGRPAISALITLAVQELLRTDKTFTLPEA